LIKNENIDVIMTEFGLRPKMYALRVDSKVKGVKNNVVLQIDNV